MRRKIKVSKQRQDYDCGIAALEMLLGVDYARLSAEARSLYDIKQGLWLWQIRELAFRFGFVLETVFRGTAYLEERTGILSVAGYPSEHEAHVVVLKDGSTVIDPEDGSVWKLSDYLSAKHARTGCLLVQT